MDTDPMRCSKCSGPMVQGFLVDFRHGGAGVGTWVEGPPEVSFWQGTKAPAARRVPVGTFRCAVCGFLESYARPEFASS